VSQIKALGVKLALDDFGTGYASLRYLRRFVFDALKLDRSFITDLGTDAGDTALVAAAISMGGALNMEVVAEGVEHAAQVRRLQGMGCTLAQGFLFARPLEAADIRSLLIAQARGESPLELLTGGQGPARNLDAHASPVPGFAGQLEAPAEGVDPFAR
jgi:EAL domain-containing protein (putative c-di-GMP-specific phosphodiesterase class I)